MAEWQYRIHKVELPAQSSLDQELETALAIYGKEGWELVQVLHPHESPANPIYRFIFKAEKPLD